MNVEMGTLLTMLGLMLTAIGILLAFITFKYSDHKTTLQDKKSRVKAIRNLKSPSFNRIYKNTLRKGLAILAVSLGKRRGITTEGIAFLYILSYTYTIAFFCISWVISGNGKIGGMSILPDIDEKIYRLFIGLALIVATYLFYLFFKEIIGINQKISNTIHRHINKRITKIDIGIALRFIAILMVGNLTFNYIEIYHEEYKNLFVVFIFASMLTPVPIIFISGSLSIAYWLTNSISIVAPVFVLGMFWGMFKINTSNTKLPNIIKKYPIHFVTIIPLVVSIKTFFRSEEYMKSFEPTVLLFMFLLPASNLILDYVSWEASRRIGYKILKSRSIVTLTSYLILDVVLAMLLLISLVILLTVFIELFNYATVLKGGIPYLNLQNIIETSIKDPLSSSNIWITLMLFTTLIPTLINGTMLIVGYVTRAVPSNFRLYVIDKLENYEAKSDLNVPAWFFSVKWIVSMNLVLLALVGVIYLINIVFNPVSYYLSEVSLAVIKVFKIP